MPTLKTTAGQLLVERALPSDIKLAGRVLDKKGTAEILEEVAARHPNEYPQVIKNLMDVGRDVYFSSGSQSFGLRDMEAPPAVLASRRRLQMQLQAIYHDSRLSDKQRADKVIEATSGERERIIDNLVPDADKAGNPLGGQVVSGARGNPMQLARLIAGDYLYTDPSDNIVPVPVLHSYSEGLEPAEYWAATYGARKGLVETKLCLWECTLVRMVDGADVEIRELKPGDRVMGANRFGRQVPMTVLRVYNNGPRFCHRFVFMRSDHRPVELFATPEHKVLVKLFGDDGSPLGRRNQLMSLAEVASMPKRNQVLGYLKKARVYVLKQNEPYGYLNTYDIEVSSSEHMFVLASGIITSNSTQKAGYTSKMLNQAAHRLMVTAADDDENQYNPKQPRGLPVPTDDMDSEGALLAQGAGGYPRHTVLTPKILKDLQSQKIPKILIRSPTVGGPEDGGVYAKDAGVRDRGGLPPLGDMIGMTAAQTLGEKLSQGMLSAKHSGGVKGSTSTMGGYPLINALMNPPKEFPGAATHASVDGSVDSVTEAPTGGWHVSVAGKEHYIPSHHELRVKKGDTIEAGDVLDSGIPNPSEIVHHKGIGEGRRYFTNAFASAFKDAGMYANRRNVELMARALIDHVEVQEETNKYVPGDVTSYHNLERTWQPRLGHEALSPKQAVGKYLESPILHYTIGTKIQPSMAKELESFGVSQVLAHKDPPPFKPMMIRAIDSLSEDPDWLTQFLGANQKVNLLDAVRRGSTSTTAGTSYVPSLVEGAPMGKEWPGMVLKQPGTRKAEEDAQNSDASTKPSILGKIKSIWGTQ